MPYRDDDDEELNDAEYADAEDADGSDDEDDTIPCPYCREQVCEDAVRCPRCENYISREDAPFRRPWWIVLTALLCLAVVLAWIFGRL